MKRVYSAVGLLIFSLFASCGDVNMSTISIAADSAATATSQTSTTTTTGAAAPNDIQSKVSTAYQDARKETKKVLAKPAKKK